MICFQQKVINVLDTLGLQDKKEKNEDYKRKEEVTPFSVYFLLFPYPKNFSLFFPHTGKNRNRRKSNLLP